MENVAVTSVLLLPFRSKARQLGRRGAFVFMFIRAVGLLAFIASSGSSIAAAAADATNRCSVMKTCGQCLAAGPPCGWCLQEDYAHPTDRCAVADDLIARGCDIASIINPTAAMTLVKNEAARNPDRTTDAVQLSPQEIKVKLRPNEPFKFTASFRQAENYPVDLYFVMDLSVSMADDKVNLARLGNQLVAEMTKLTPNFRLGFGSFVDKKAMPFVSMVPSSLAKPCDNPVTGEACVPPFGFHNILPLTDDTGRFESVVQNAAISGNLDNLEGGFDAIMQAIVCRSEIGWRNQSRKMLLYASDGGFHCAGDGLLAGIVIPNDGKCHLNRQGYYSESLNQDYPSISQLAGSISESKINVIFAVTANQAPVYTQLSQFIEGSTHGELAGDSSNIIELIKENYRKISGIVELKTEGDENLSVAFKTKCLGNSTITGTRGIRCDGVGLSDTVTFEVSIETQSCPADRSQWRRSVKIYPVGLNEHLIVNLELNCECDCEQASLAVANSARCNSSGTYQCGVCACNEGRYGSFCECDGSKLSSADLDATCKRTNTSEVCEGRGSCLCGTCSCHAISSTGDQSRRYMGKHCQCNNYNCDLDRHGELCGGPQKGVCQCGRCECLPGWTGGSCDCSTDTSTCLAKNGVLCNGIGKCECGRCVCDPTSNYGGTTCEFCPLCPEGCDNKRPCAECRAFQDYSKLSKESCAANCSHVTLVDEFSHKDNAESWRQCQYRNADNCNAYFRYNYYAEEQFEALKTASDCPEPVDYLPIIIGVIVGIILIGLALLVIWKICVTLHDRREFAKFENERENAQWESGQNPIYKQATSTYQNPQFGKD